MTDPFFAAAEAARLLWQDICLLGRRKIRLQQLTSDTRYLSAYRAAVVSMAPSGNAVIPHYVAASMCKQEFLARASIVYDGGVRREYPVPEYPTPKC